MDTPQIQIRTETGICHLRAHASGSLSQLLQKADLSPLEISADQERIQDWLSGGSVYVEGQRTLSDIQLEAGQIVRLHTRRKAYPAAQLENWRARLVEDNGSFIVFDKPAGLPTHATLDNFKENAKYVLEQELGITLYTTHRLDIPTQGLLILAKTPEAQAHLNKLFAKGRVQKTYHALSHRAVQPGAYTHYIDGEARVPRPITTEPRPGWWECRLEVDSWGRDASQKRNQVPYGIPHRVRLLTGKTHQIRAQFAALGAPLIGDSIYGGEPAAELGLECYQLQWPGHSYTRPRSLVKHD